MEIKLGHLGCIGILEADSSKWLEAFRSIPNGDYTVLEVFI
jgi:hypothetical protein